MNASEGSSTPSRASQILPIAPEMRKRASRMTVGEALFFFDGRMCRSDCWLKGFLPLLPVGILNNILAYGVGGNALLFSYIIGLASLWPALALTVKRLHDRDLSAHVLWVFLIPFVGQICMIWILVEVWFLKGTTGPNRYGADPLESET